MVAGRRSMDYDERMTYEKTREEEIYSNIIDLLENGDVAIDFTNIERQKRILGLNRFVVNLLSASELDWGMESSNHFLSRIIVDDGNGFIEKRFLTSEERSDMLNRISEDITTQGDEQ